MSENAITWDATPKRLAADPAATLALDRSAWEALGASFREMDDGQGEKPGLATAIVQTSNGSVSVGILDYGEAGTYLLVPGVEPERFANTAAVLEALEALGAVNLAEDLLDLADAVPAPTLEERIAQLERQLAEVVRSSSFPRPTENVPVKASGTVKWFSDDKGFGFIEPDEISEQPGGVSPRSVKVHGDGKGISIKGTVKWFSDEKGYGFVTPDDGGKDLFVHHSKVIGQGYRSLAEGTRIEYEVEGSEGSPRSTRKRRAK